MDLQGIRKTLEDQAQAIHLELLDHASEYASGYDSDEAWGKYLDIEGRFHRAVMALALYKISMNIK